MTENELRTEKKSATVVENICWAVEDWKEVKEGRVNEMVGMETLRKFGNFCEEIVSVY